MQIVIEEAGSFQNTSSITLHSREAVMVINGLRYKKAKYVVPSLNRCSKMIRSIYNAVQNDNPYAENVLIDVEQRISRAYSIFETLHKKLNYKRSLCRLPRGMKINLLESTKLSELSLNHELYRNTHVMHLIFLICEFDFLMRKARTYKEYGVINSDYFNKLKRRTKGVMCSVMSTPASYKAKHVTREDILNKTETGVAAIKEYGMLPIEILEGKKLSEHGPRVFK